ncbi:hypothetical protein HWI79_1886 [Cryptosporidium felis]|nr:hypothetical protein HWI79_1886 [Cryptosporidium felis]
METKKSDNFEEFKNLKRPSYIVFDKNKILTPNHYREIPCFSPPIYFVDIVNIIIVSLEVACNGTYLFINRNGELSISLPTEKYNVNDRTVERFFYFDYSLDQATYILKEYASLSGIENKPDELTGINLDAIPREYDTNTDGDYINWVRKVELFGIITFSDQTLMIPEYKKLKEELKADITAFEELFIIFLIDSNDESKNIHFIAIPVFFLTKITFNVRKSILEFHFESISSTNTETFDLKKGVHSFKGINLKTNKIHNEKILFSTTLNQLQKLIKFRFNELKNYRDLTHESRDINYKNTNNELCDTDHTMNNVTKQNDYNYVIFSPINSTSKIKTANYTITATSTTTSTSSIPISINHDSMTASISNATIGGFSSFNSTEILSKTNQTKHKISLSRHLRFYHSIIGNII